MENKKEKYVCRCGSRVEKLTTYVNKSGGRITVCSNCASESGLVANTNYAALDYEAYIEVKQPVINNELKLN